MLNVTLTTL